MAAIDSLLRLISMQKAEALVLNTNKAPGLIHAGLPRLLSMPPLTASMLDTFLQEVFTPEQLEVLPAAGMIEGAYHSEKNGTFAVKVRVSGPKLVATFRPTSMRTHEHPLPVHDPRPETPTSALEPGQGLDSAPRGLEADGQGAGALPRGLEPVHHVLATPPRALAGLLENALSESASDLVLSTGELPAMRTGGEWREIPGEPTLEQDLLALLDPAMTAVRRKQLVQTGNIDLSLGLALREGGSRRFRVNVFRQVSGLSAAFRPILEEVPSLQQLNLPDSLRALADIPYGLVLVTGPTGSGKSTTLAAMIELLNRSRARHILTLEDPIEYLYTRKRSIIHQREVGTHVESFAAGLKAALREAPDVILLGEMRDRETISAAVTAAETGHLVLSTLHTGTAAMAIDRMIDVFPEHQQSQARAQLAAVLRTVVTQRLLPGVQAGTRVPALEILQVNYAVANLIRERKAYQIASQMQIGREEGMVSMEQSVTELLRTGKISRETAARASADVVQMKEWLKEKGG